MELQGADLNAEVYQQQYDAITEKICLCEGLCASAYIKLGINKPRENKAVAICPGPNLAYFNRLYSLDEMVKHIYGHINLLDKVKRPHMFIKELNLYIDYLQKDLQAQLITLTGKKKKYFHNFKNQLQQGINYYKELVNRLPNQTAEMLQSWYAELSDSEFTLNQIDLEISLNTDIV